LQFVTKVQVSTARRSAIAEQPDRIEQALTTPGKFKLTISSEDHCNVSDGAPESCRFS